VVQGGGLKGGALCFQRFASMVRILPPPLLGRHSNMEGGGRQKDHVDKNWDLQVRAGQQLVPLRWSSDALCWSWPPNCNQPYGIALPCSCWLAALQAVD
jgi:hypothetical protein